MGRIKTRLIKRLCHEFVTKYKAQLNGEFNHNKLMVNQCVEGASSKLRNVIAGYTTRLMKRGSEYPAHAPPKRRTYGEYQSRDRDRRNRDRD